MRRNPIPERNKKTLFKNSNFLTFFGFVVFFGLNYGSFFYEKIVKINENYNVECLKDLENMKVSRDLFLNEVDKCRKQKWKAVITRIVTGYALRE